MHVMEVAVPSPSPVWVQKSAESKGIRARSVTAYLDEPVSCTTRTLLPSGHSAVDRTTLGRTFCLGGGTEARLGTPVKKQ